MLTIKEILFPVDFSERTCGAAPFVSAVAEQFGARVTLMSVAPPLWYAAMGDVDTPVYIDPDELRADLQARLEGILVKELGQLPVARALYRKFLAMKEDDYIHIEGWRAPQVAEQQTMAHKMHTIDRVGEALSVSTVLTGLILAFACVYAILNHVR